MTVIEIIDVRWGHGAGRCFRTPLSVFGSWNTPADISDLGTFGVTS
jgi:hypothetical protein